MMKLILLSKVFFTASLCVLLIISKCLPAHDHRIMDLDRQHCYTVLPLCSKRCLMWVLPEELKQQKIFINKTFLFLKNSHVFRWGAIILFGCCHHLLKSNVQPAEKRLLRAQKKTFQIGYLQIGYTCRPTTG